MTDLSVKRTLVKSPPELWSELSEVESLAQHLGELGEIRISRLEPEHTVAWEGEQVRGTVEIEAAGWGTKVTLTAEVVEAPASEHAPADPVVGGVESEALEVEAGEVGSEAGEVEVGEVEAGASAYEPDPPPAREPLAPQGNRPRRRRGLLGRWLARRRRAEASPATGARAAAIGPVLASSIADGTVDVVEKGSGRPDRGVTPAADPPYEAERVGLLPEGAGLRGEAGGETEPVSAAPASALESARAVLESTLDSLGQAHHRPFSREQRARRGVG